MLEEEKVSKSEADKEKANSRLGGYMGHLKEARGELQVAKNRIEDLETLLAFEEKSGFFDTGLGVARRPRRRQYSRLGASQGGLSLARLTWRRTRLENSILAIAILTRSLIHT